MKSENIRLSIDVPSVLHKVIKFHIAENHLNIKNYVLNLIKEDLNSKMSSYKKIYSMADGSQKKEESILLPAVLILGVTSWLIYKYAEIVR